MYDDCLKKMDQPRIPQFEINKGIGNRLYENSIEGAISILSFYLGLNYSRHESIELCCRMPITKEGMVIVFEISPRGYGQDIHIGLEISQKLIIGSSKVQYIFSDYEERLFKFTESLKLLCNENGIKTNLYGIKKCVTCNRLLVIGNIHGVCQFCCPAMYEQEGNEKKKNKGFVYFCTDGECIKIGASNKYPDKRVRNLSTKYHKKFELLGYIYTEDFLKKEKELHKIFSKHRVRGEWFEISPEELESELKSLVDQYIFQLAKTTSL